jgi:VCBS repeat-containing protein
VNGVGDDDNDAFGIDGSGNLVTAANIDYETQASYSVLIRSTDASGLYTEQFFIITVLAVNDNAPIFSSSATFNVAENTTAVGTVIATDADLPGQTVTYSITGGADSTLFSIDSATGILTFNVAPNYESPTDAGANNVYNVEVTANDNSGLTTVQSIAVTVTPVNDNAPIFSSSTTFNVAENTTAVGTVVATDADLPDQTVTYSITGGADSALFSIDSATGILTFNVAPNYESPIDAGANNVYNVDVTANDNSGSTTVQSIAVTVTPVNDNAPVFTSSASVNVAENSTVATTVVATDADLPAQSVTYSITGGVDATLFSVDPITGKLSFLTPPDYEHPTDVGANNSYEVQVTANDGAGMSTAQDLTVTVTNVVEAPLMTLNPNDATYVLGKKNASVDPTASYQADITATDYSAAQLTVSITVNRQATDILRITPQGNKPGQINVKGKNVLYGGVVIGTFKGGTRANPTLVITLNSSASAAAVDALAKQISFFAKKGRNASQASRTVQMQVTNVSGQDGNQATRVINIVGAV